MRRLHLFLAALAVSPLLCGAIRQAQADYTAPKATYLFNNTLAAEQLGVPALVPTDPLGLSDFETDTPFGQVRRVYDFVGDANPPADQAGLTLDTTGLLTSDHYSAELVFKFLGGTSAWRRVVDVQDRQSDNGFYVNPSNAIAIYPVTGSPDAFTTDVYHHVAYTNDRGTAKGYLDGILEFTATTNVMDVNNPSRFLHLFLDNVAGPAQTEFSSGKIAMARFYDSILTYCQVAVLASDPFADPGSMTPFPGDANGDKVVDFTDLGILLNNYNQPGTFATGDFDCSGSVDFTDLGILLNNYNQHAPGATSAATAPEPSTLVLGCIAVLGLSIAARRKR